MILCSVYGSCLSQGGAGPTSLIKLWKGAQHATLCMNSHGQIERGDAVLITAFEDTDGYGKDW